MFVRSNNLFTSELAQLERANKFVVCNCRMTSTAVTVNLVRWSENFFSSRALRPPLLSRYGCLLIRCCPPGTPSCYDAQLLCQGETFSRIRIQETLKHRGYDLLRGHWLHCCRVDLTPCVQGVSSPHLCQSGLENHESTTGPCITRMLLAQHGQSLWSTTRC